MRAEDQDIAGHYAEIHEEERMALGMGRLTHFDEMRFDHCAGVVPNEVITGCDGFRPTQHGPRDRRQTSRS